MFGESDSESPCLGSPWDTFIVSSLLPVSSSSTELEVKTQAGEPFPKLVPEVEYGNVEYKLKLLNPSPDRFTRLVTQMKWRLLEGGGQAYYELGVADSGQLVGLPRKDLEQSLETLEMMAGEIGASIIVVKEIEVPVVLIGRGMNFALGIPQRTPPAATSLSAITTTDTETCTEDDDSPYAGWGIETPPDDGNIQMARPIIYRQAHTNPTRSHPERPASQSSPAIRATVPASTEELDADPVFNLDFEIEISSVYKPRPHRRRSSPKAQSKYTGRGSVPKQQHACERGNNVDLMAKEVEKLPKRDARRDQGQHTLLAPDVGLTVQQERTTIARIICDVTVQLDSSPVSESELTTPEPIDLSLQDKRLAITVAPEPRFIVEALVVRKLALEEAFLDFGGFALEI